MKSYWANRTILYLLLAWLAVPWLFSAQDAVASAEFQVLKVLDQVIVPLFLRKLVLGIRAQASGKNYVATIAFGGPSRPASLVAYPTRGMQLSYAMTRRDFVKPVFSLRFAP